MIRPYDWYTERASSGEKRSGVSLFASSSKRRRWSIHGFSWVRWVRLSSSGIWWYASELIAISNA